MRISSAHPGQHVRVEVCPVVEAGRAAVPELFCLNWPKMISTASVDFDITAPFHSQRFLLQGVPAA